MKTLLPILALLATCLMPACGGSGGPSEDAPFTHPMFTAENAYSVVVDPNNVVSIVGPDGITAPPMFAELVESGEYALVTEAGIEAAAQARIDQAAADRDAALLRFDNDPEALALVNFAIDPNDPNARELPDGNVLFKGVEADPANGVEERWFSLGGHHVLDPGLLDAAQRAPTLENQIETYAAIYEDLPTSYITQNQLPAPDTLGNQTVTFVSNLVLQIAGEWRVFLPQPGPSSPPAGWPATWRDEDGAGSALQPPRGLDRAGPETLPTGLWADVDFPLKWCATHVRDQGRRNLCAFFAVTAAVEARFAAKRSRWVNLCEQLLYNQNQRVWNYSGDHGEAGWPSTTMVRMDVHSFAYPYEYEWDYNRCVFRISDNDRRAYYRSCWGDALGATLYPGAFCSDTNHQSPGICALVDGRVFCATRDPGRAFLRGGAGSSGLAVQRWFTVSHYDAPANHVLAKLCLALKIPVTFCFGVPAFGFNSSDGFCFIDTLEPDRVGGAHCVVLLGYIENADLPPGVPPGDGGGYYIGKNSWGTTFGDSGYFYASDAWVDKYGAGMYAVAQVTG